jgi:uncharacterized protein with PIN domain
MRKIVKPRKRLNRQRRFIFVREKMPVQLGFTDYPKCPKCNVKAELVPIYEYSATAVSGTGRGASERPVWKCVNCGNTIR